MPPTRNGPKKRGDGQRQKRTSAGAAKKAKVRTHIKKMAAKADKKVIVTKASDAFANDFIVFTGQLETSKDVLEAKAKAAGAKVRGSVSKETTVLVAGAGAGFKLLQADTVGATTITEPQFLARCE